MGKYVVPGLPQPGGLSTSQDGRVAGLPQLGAPAIKQRADIVTLIRPALRRSERQFHQAALSLWVKTVIRRMKEEGCHVVDVAPGYVLASALDDVVCGYRSDILSPEHPRKGNPPSNEDWMLWLNIVVVVEIARRATSENTTLRDAIKRAVNAIDAAIKKYGGTDQSVVALMPGSGREPPNAVRRSDQSQQRVAYERFVNRCLERRDNLMSGQGLPGGKDGQIALTFRENLEGIGCLLNDPKARLENELEYVAGVTAHLLLTRRRDCG
jgi:hypothetical protein